MVSNHHPYQIAGHPMQPRPPNKFHNHWTIRTPPGWSCLFIPPMNQPNGVVEIAAGVVDHRRVHLADPLSVLLAIAADGLYTLEKGTPLVQVIPFRREDMQLAGEVRAERSRKPPSASASCGPPARVTAGTARKPARNADMRAASALAFTAAGFAAGCSHLPSGGLQDAIDALSRDTDSVAVLHRRPCHLHRAPPCGWATPTCSAPRRCVGWLRSARRRADLDHHRRKRQRTTRDFFTPVLEQTLPDRRITSELSGQPGALWPLSVGKTATFSESRTVALSTSITAFNRDITTQLRWTCEVVDTRVSQVPAGDFDTFHVACKAYRQGFFLPVQTVTWDYAPSLGHYVRRTWFEGGRQRQSVLGAALPGPLATAPRIASTLQRLQQTQQP